MLFLLNMKIFVHRYLSSLCFILHTLLIILLHSSRPSYLICASPQQLLAAPAPINYLDCPASRCGALSNISFPFALTGASANNTGASSCAGGLPEFRLLCNTTHLSWWPDHFLLPLSSILNITSNHITSGTFVAGPPPFSSGLEACSPPLQEHPTFSNSSSLPTGLQFSPHGNIVLLTNCSQNLTQGLHVNETVEGFSFSSPSCLQYYSVCWNQSSSYVVPATRVPCLEAISAEANVSLVRQRYGCTYSISLYELPQKKQSALSMQISWTISQSYYDCKACEASNGSCSINGVDDSFRCLCAGNASTSTSYICSSVEASKSCKGLCQNYVQFFLGAAAIAVAILVVGSSFGVYCCRRRARLIYMQGGRPPTALPMSRLDSSSKDHLEQILAWEDGTCPDYTRKFAYRELHEATNGFAERNILGDGGFGTVYEGTLGYCSEKVAVKRLFTENARRVEQFLNEIRILSTLYHPNLVRLHGFCCESFTELLLVYEFASNGSLADNLHGMTGKVMRLSWEMRLCIALETAGALAYMHERDPPILHRDVKSSNILLDGNFHAKLADFGLSRRAHGMKTAAAHVTTGPQGTPGYVDPQYQQCYRLTDKSDVYSFGVVLMELISGKAPVDMSRRHTDHINLSSLAVAKIQTGALDELIDPRLLQGRGDAAQVQDTVARVAELAFLCLAPLQDDRPSMSQVALALLDMAHSLSPPHDQCETD